MATREAIARADALLLERLSPEQREDFARTKSFLVTTPGGRRWRLHGDRVNYQADLLAPDSEYVLAQYCVQPAEDGVPRADSLLAQMLLLEGDEARFLLTANEVLLVPHLHLHRWLNGEIRPPLPPTPQHEPDNACSNQGERRTSPRARAMGQIQTDYRCANHPDAAVWTLRESPDGRGVRVRYHCDCQTQYVSFRAHENRISRLHEESQRHRAEQNHIIRALVLERTR